MAEPLTPHPRVTVIPYTPPPVLRDTGFLGSWQNAVQQINDAGQPATDRTYELSELVEFNEEELSHLVRRGAILPLAALEANIQREAQQMRERRERIQAREEAELLKHEVP